jgi:hypothetical protein
MPRQAPYRIVGNRWWTHTDARFWKMSHTSVTGSVVSWKASHCEARYTVYDCIKIHRRVVGTLMILISKQLVSVNRVYSATATFT